MIINVPPNSHIVWFNAFTRTYQAYPSGYHYVGLNYWFMNKTAVIIRDKYRYQIPTTIYPDVITNYPIITATKLHITIDCSAYIKVLDPLKVVKTLKDIDSQVDSICKAELRNRFSTLEIDQIITTQETLEKKLLESINEDLKDYGLMCVGFTLTKVQLPVEIEKSVTEITSEQMEQKCKLIEAETQSKVLEVKSRQRIQQVKNEMEIKLKKHEMHMKKLKDFKVLDPQFNINTYIENKFKTIGYKRCKNLIMCENLKTLSRLSQLESLEK